ncbi:hypothetical protein L227DRAFT_617651 [Lentinus tigrinus ALCF2SS1-6]|uniref:F-box domain-containing protein n=2 Tax=Lentinus tigrinus TaxID=5365 RepID=A0A5C2RNE9_9APHY|nr:hypothetical protein L227DRAFT_617651 [Lentinus tigrinus ALCF2SS1-6]
MPPNACHQALYTVEILEAVLADETADQGVCKRIALTCQLFSQVALPFVWRDLDSLLPLWGVLLPDGLPPSFDPYTDPGQRTEFVKQILQKKTYDDPARWQRFLTYASFVRELSYFGVNPSGSDGNLIHALILRNGRSSFLPRLQCLYWHYFNHARDLLPMLCTSSLTELHLIIHGDTPESHRTWSSLLDATSPPEALLPYSAPSLRTLEFDCSVDVPEVVVTALMATVPRFQNLRSFFITPCDIGPPMQVAPRDLPTLLAAPALEELDCIVGGLDDHPGIPATFTASHLRKLCLTGYFEELSPVICSTWQAPQLQELSICADRWSTAIPVDISNILADLSSSSIAPTLRALSVAAENWSDLDNPLEADLVDMISPCLSLTSLESLYVHYDASADIKISCLDESMLRLARSLGNLKSLSVHTTGRALEPGEQPSLTTLLHFAEHCPHLVELMLKIPLDVVGALPSVLTRPGANHPLRELLLAPHWAPPFGDRPAQVARFLDGVFPKLDVRQSRQMAGLRYMPREQDQDRFMAEVWNEVEALQRGRVGQRTETG